MRRQAVVAVPASGPRRIRRRRRLRRLLVTEVVVLGLALVVDAVRRQAWLSVVAGVTSR
jgi:hypothetical protein